MIRKIIITGFLVTLLGISLKGQVVINEFMASNQGVFKDSLGQSSDWIELYNNGPLAVNLEEYYLSDDPDEIQKWTFPDIEIESGNFLLLFASGNDRYDGYFHHTNFRLNSSGEHIILSSSEGLLLDQIEFGQQFSNISRGRLEDANDDFVYFDPGTPGYSNATGDTVEPISTDIFFSTAPGFYKRPIALELFAGNTAHQIYYTTNGEPPHTGTSLYSGPILLRDDNMPEVFLSHVPTGIGWRLPVGEVNQCHIIRAQAFMDGQPVGEERKGSFFIEEDGDDRYKLPVLSVITDAYNLFEPDTGIYFYGLNENYLQKGREWERKAYVEYYEDGDLVLFQDLGIRVSGNLSRIRPQKSIKLYPRNEYGKAKLSYPFFGEDYESDFKRIVLRALNNNWTPTGISDDVAHQISHEQDLNYEYQRRRFVVVFMNGEYWGVHSLREPIDEHYIERNFGVDEEDLLIDGIDFDEFRSYVENNDMSINENYQNALRNIDLNNLLDYYVSELFFANHDWPHNNSSVWRSNTDDGKWRYIFFDLDGGMQQYKHGYFRMFFEPEELHVREDRFHGFKFLRSLLQNEDFRADFKSKLIYHLNTSFRPDVTIPIFREVMEEIKPEIKEHQRRWNYPHSYRRWQNSIESTAGFFILRPDVLLSDVFKKLGIPMDIYPNPVSQVANGELELGKDQEVSFYLSSMNGTMIYLGSFQMFEGKNNFSFDLSEHSSDMYLLSAITQSQIYNTKIILAK